MMGSRRWCSPGQGGGVLPTSSALQLCGCRFRTPWHLQCPGAPHSKLSQCRAETLSSLLSPPSSSNDAQLQDLGRSGSLVVCL